MCGCVCFPLRTMEQEDDAVELRDVVNVGMSFRTQKSAISDFNYPEQRKYSAQLHCVFHFSGNEREILLSFLSEFVCVRERMSG